jgi:hypothetical protein
MNTRALFSRRDMAPSWKVSREKVSWIDFFKEADQVSPSISKHV